MRTPQHSPRPLICRTSSRRLLLLLQLQQRQLGFLQPRPLRALHVLGLGLRQELGVADPRLEKSLLFALGERGSLTTFMGDSKWSAGSSTAASTSSVSLGPIICALLYRQLQSQRHDGPVVLFWPHVDDVSEASPPVCDTCGRIHVDPGVRESHVKLGQGSELIIALDQ